MMSIWTYKKITDKHNGIRNISEILEEEGLKGWEAYHITEVRTFSGDSWIESIYFKKMTSLINN